MSLDLISELLQLLNTAINNIVMCIYDRKSIFSKKSVIRDRLG